MHLFIALFFFLPDASLFPAKSSGAEAPKKEAGQNCPASPTLLYIQISVRIQAHIRQISRQILIICLTSDHSAVIPAQG